MFFNYANTWDDIASYNKKKDPANWTDAE